MDWKYIDDNLPKHIDGWTSPALGIHMPVVVYGDRGKPLLIFPTAAADFLENERFNLINSIQHQIFAGKVRVFSIDSINKLAWMDKNVPVPEQARRQALYMRYVEEELVPFIRTVCGNPQVRIATSGASFGAYHALNTLCRRPDLFDTTIAMSGFYDLAPDYLRGHADDNCYFNNPAWYIKNIGGHYLELLRTSCSINLVTGQGAYEVPEESINFGRILWERGIPNNVDLWGRDVNHDWPWWRKMLPHYIDRLGW
jgi:esterase/lipase superfamily enzyme